MDDSGASDTDDVTEDIATEEESVDDSDDDATEDPIDGTTDDDIDEMANEMIDQEGEFNHIEAGFPIFEVIFDAVADDATEGTFQSEIDGEMTTGTTAASQVEFAGKTIPVLTMTLNGDDEDDAPISFWILKQTDQVYFLIDTETNALHFMASSQSAIQDWVDQFNELAFHHGGDLDGEHGGGFDDGFDSDGDGSIDGDDDDFDNDGDGSIDDDMDDGVDSDGDGSIDSDLDDGFDNDGDGGIDDEFNDDDVFGFEPIELDDFSPAPELKSYFTEAGSFSYVDEEGVLVLTFSDNIISNVGTDGLTETVNVDYLTGDFDVIAPEEDDPLLLLPLPELLD